MRNLLLPFVLAVLATVSLGAGPQKEKTEKAIRAGVFLGNGASGYSGENAVEALMIDPGIQVRRVTANELLTGALSDLDVLVFPGGGGGRQVNDMGALVTEKVRAFVREEGKGAVGICAGAYLLSDTPGYACLHLAGVSAVDREHDERGHGIVAFTPTEEGLALFPELRGKETRHLYYYEGPLLVPSEGGPPFQVLGSFVSDVHLENEAPAGLMPGKPIFVSAEPGKGRVFLTAGHPEATPGMRWMLPRMVRWASRREAISYTDAVVRPQEADREILFDEALRKEEKALFETLLYGAAGDKITAIGRLAAVRSWDGPRWIAGCLRSGEAEVRQAAAKALAASDATWALPDVKGVLSGETDPRTRATLAFAAARLSAMRPAVPPSLQTDGRREMAVTFDDLPVVSAPGEDQKTWRALTWKLLGELKKEKVPAVGFVVGSKLEGPEGHEPWRADLLQSWLGAGLELGNHTYSHLDLHTTPVESFLEDVQKDDDVLRPMLTERAKVPRWFRHPMLHTGTTPEVKKAVADFLAQHGYTMAPVTVDNSEWIFAKAYSTALKKGDAALASRVAEAYVPYMEAKVAYFERQSVVLFGREVRQVLLLHANQLNADALPQLLGMLKRRGYDFVTLDRTLEDDAYALPDGYFGKAGITWLHRWCLALGGKSLLLPDEPLCPGFVLEAAGLESE